MDESRPNRRRRIEVEELGLITVVHFVDSKILDEQNIQLIGDDLFRLVDELGKTRILLSFSRVDYLSSAALGKIVRFHQKLAAAGGKLVVCSISKDVKEVFVITRLEKFFHIAEDAAAGLLEF